MKIPKQRARTAISKEGIEYAKVEDIRFPILSYFLSIPIRQWWKLKLMYKIWGFKQTKRKKSIAIKSSKLDEKQECKVELSYSKSLLDLFPFASISKGIEVAGNCKVSVIHKDADAGFGTDVLEFVWHVNDSNTIRVLHMPSYFLRLMFSNQADVEGEYLDKASENNLMVFEKYLVIRDAKSLIDDRTYEKIIISKKKHEVHLKYIGLKISIAYDPKNQENLIIYLEGVLGTEDILDPFLIEVPHRKLMNGSSAMYDSEDQAWVEI